ncbi:hypothetical protein JQ636_11290 [Bradyrhizobium japonicum]|uniref:Eco57I restriction-modification methylase domain-containing protein n=1 Tax=Bradyrhizobium japonicum TaxID=375 RepID=UPI001BA555DA|nr:type IIL restriction-modification enzyme MmeI [Bradyrhizobium japonicum]MBR0804124.1 hypothetical protein [Bradyrhizobium japonicum]
MSGPSVSRHHADWLSLVEVSGPFVSLPVLMRVFPQGLEPRDPAQAKALRAAYEEWQDNPAIPGSQRAWVMHVLIEALGYEREQIAEGQALPAGLEAKMPEMGEALRPDIALIGPAGSDTAGRAQLLIASYPAEQALDKPVTGKHWKATPATRMMELLHGTGVPLGLITNGEQWMLVYGPRGETTGYATWYGALWLDEPITLRAFQSLLGVRRFFGVASESTLLALLKESANDQQEVTDQLGYQVREAVEVLVKSVDTLDRENGRALLKDLPETVLYDAALTIMMRLVFLFAAEERGLLHLGKPLYDENYAVSTLQEQLQEIADQHGEEVLERRFDAWTRLLATFRAVHAGIQHQDLLMLAYGGSLFDPDRYPFLEGRAALSSWKTAAAEPLAVNNRVVLHLLNSLQRLQVRLTGGGAAESRRISFRALGVEQIGHVYEGLLDRTAVRASETVLGMKGARDKEREIPLATLELRSRQGQDKLIKFLEDETGRSTSALKRALDEVYLPDEHKLLIACGHDKNLLERIRPFYNLIREDSFDRPLVTPAAHIYITASTTRRSTGTHYTPPSLTEPIVQHTLEPLVYEGPMNGLPREQWTLKSPRAILDLKVCDMAMGSGAFLVQACRYLAERLVESWEVLEKQRQGEVLITPEGNFSTGAPSERLVPADTNERVAIARRVIADRCIYGVDVNAMAVEMAKLSLWLLTLQRDLPFTFLDHALKCGDSLLGIVDMREIDNFSLRPGAQQATFAIANLASYVEESSAKRRALEELPSNDHAQIEIKSRLHAEAESATATVKALADCLVGLELRGLDGEAYEEQRAVGADRAEIEMRRPLMSFQNYAREQSRGMSTFHWPLEFPEVFDRGGFDAFMGNPPFMGGLKISGALGDVYRRWLDTQNRHGGGRADLCAYFLLRGSKLKKRAGTLGMIATNTIAEGETRDTGLVHLVKSGERIYQAWRSLPWPGRANLSVSILYLVGSEAWHGEIVLDAQPVANIAPSLTAESDFLKPHKLAANLGLSFQGANVHGMGFVLETSEAKRFLEMSSPNSECIFQFMNGDDLNNEPQQVPTRWVIDFRDLPLEECETRWPAVMKRIRELVKPIRDHQKDKRAREKWWCHYRPATSLYNATRNLGRFLATCEVTKHLSFSFVAPGWILSSNVDVIALDGDQHFAILQSTIHEVWARAQCAHLETRLKYSNGNAFETFAFPSGLADLKNIGSEYHAHRHSIMTSRREGLTATYNRFHDRNERSEDIIKLRTLHSEMDRAAAAAYGWSDLQLGHDFHETRQGLRYTISEPARRAILERLLVINYQRYAEQEAEKSAQAITAPVKRGRKKRASPDKLTLDLL